MRSALERQRLVVLCALGVLLLNFPLLALWNSDAHVAGWPVFPVALFAIWCGLIAVLAWIMERGFR